MQLIIINLRCVIGHKIGYLMSQMQNSVLSVLYWLFLV